MVASLLTASGVTGAGQIAHFQIILIYPQKIWDDSLKLQLMTTMCICTVFLLGNFSLWSPTEFPGNYQFFKNVSLIFHLFFCGLPSLSHNFLTPAASLQITHNLAWEPSQTFSKVLWLMGKKQAQFLICIDKWTEEANQNYKPTYFANMKWLECSLVGI